MRHTPEHDVWAPDGRCDVLIMEEDGTVTRCGYVPGRASFDASQAPLPTPVRTDEHAMRNVVVGVLAGSVGLAIALDWVAFIMVVSRGDNDPRLAVAFIMRLAMSALYGAAVVWLWRRR